MIIQLILAILHLPAHCQLEWGGLIGHKNGTLLRYVQGSVIRDSVPPFHWVFICH
jgi:hypothetical protein